MVTAKDEEDERATPRALTDADAEWEPPAAVSGRVPSASAFLKYKRASFALLRLEPGAMVLDVGCGAGEDAAALTELVGPSGLVMGVDASHLMLAQARERHSGSGARLEFRRGKAEALELPSATFDAARADRLLHLVRQPAAVLQEMGRVVRPGGRVVISEPDHNTFTLDASDEDVTARIVNHWRDETSSRIPGSRVRRLCAAAGLTNVELRVDTTVATSFDLAGEALGLSVVVQDAVAAGVLSAEEALRWCASARDDSARGLFLATMTTFTVAGVRPRHGPAGVDFYKR